MHLLARDTMKRHALAWYQKRALESYGCMQCEETHLLGRSVFSWVVMAVT